MGKKSSNRPWRGMSSTQVAPLTFWFKPEFRLEVGTHMQKKTRRMWEKIQKSPEETFN